MPLSDDAAAGHQAAGLPEQLRCQTCSGGVLAAEAVNTALWHGDRLVVIEDVPALVCQHCGERYYEDETAMALDMMRGRGFAQERAARMLAVPVFSFERTGRGEEG